MDIELWKTIAELGIGGVALLMFYKLITKQNDNHREDRKTDSEMWRQYLREKSDRSNAVIQELTSVIREINTPKSNDNSDSNSK